LQKQHEPMKQQRKVHLSDCPQKISLGSHVGISIREKNLRAGVAELVVHPPGSTRCHISSVASKNGLSRNIGGI